jgi:hypothetical protein
MLISPQYFLNRIPIFRNIDRGGDIGILRSMQEIIEIAIRSAIRRSLTQIDFHVHIPILHNRRINQADHRHRIMEGSPIAPGKNFLLVFVVFPHERCKKRGGFVRDFLHPLNDALFDQNLTGHIQAIHVNRQAAPEDDVRRFGVDKNIKLRGRSFIIINYGRSSLKLQRKCCK